MPRPVTVPVGDRFDDLGVLPERRSVARPGPRAIRPLVTSQVGPDAFVNLAQVRTGAPVHEARVKGALEVGKAIR